MWSFWLGHIPPKTSSRLTSVKYGIENNRAETSAQLQRGRNEKHDGVKMVATLTGRLILASSSTQQLQTRRFPCSSCMCRQIQR